jgi:CheY-like chemotaxis protein
MRIAIAAPLLAQVARVDGAPVVAEICVAAGCAVGAAPPLSSRRRAELERFLDELARLFERAIARIDGGRPASAALTAADLRLLRSRLTRLLGRDGARTAGSAMRERTARIATGASRRKPWFLVFVDSAPRRSQLGERFRAAGAAFATAADLAAARRLMDDRPRPAAILCDNVVPSRHLAGLLAARSAPEPIRNLEGAPVILVSASPSPGLLERAAKLGADGVWTEPFRIVDLESHLRRQRRGASAPD